MNKELILTIYEHIKFGPVFLCYIITRTNDNSFYSSIEKANSINIKDIKNSNKASLEIFKLISEYDDNKIADFFTKKKEDAREFIKNVDEEFVTQRIRPFIERRIFKIYNLLPNADVKVYYKERGYSQLYETDLIQLANSKAHTVFNFIRHDEGLDYFLTINNNGENISLLKKKIVFLTDSPCIFMLNSNLYYLSNIDKNKLLPFISKNNISIKKQTEKAYFEKFVLNTIRSYKVNAKGFEIKEIKEPPVPLLFFQNDMNSSPTLLLKFKYGNNTILANNPNTYFVNLTTKGDNYTFEKNIRLKNIEKQFTDSLKELFLTKDSTHFYTPKSNNDLYLFIDYINENIEQIKEKGFDIIQSFFSNKYNFKKPSIQLSINKSKDWFDVKGTVELGDFKIPFLRLRKHLLSSNREYILPDNTVAILPEEWFTKYKKLFSMGNNIQDGIRFKNYQFGILDEKEIASNTNGFEQIKELFTGNFNKEYTPPQNLKASLRPYQLEGFKWMMNLNESGFGGCLADDMGLGKTLQTLTLLLNESNTLVDRPVFENTPVQQYDLFNPPPQNIFAKKDKMSPTSIIIMPTSLIFNWESEIKKFTPSLKTLKYTGTHRTEDISIFTKYDIILTTYGVVRNDFESLKKFPFHYIILDESQAIKTPASKAYKAVIKLQSSHKLVITGTPVENSLTDLWSQINFINPGLLGNTTFFKNEFVTPIEKYGDEAKSDWLKSLIHPFILRRNKDEVAKDLPPKTEQLRYCTMSAEQKKIYEKTKSAVRNSILEKIDKNKSENTGMMVLQALTKLRQLANHPMLNGIDEESGKFDEVTRILNNIIAEKHKVLIFSSFVEHLRLYENYLKENNIKYSILTGQTSDRQNTIEQFQNNEDNRVFLISLKAGGVGLNLTAADYVFLLDPWWNPAAESQAINRAHRIGQDKKVFVYRFITSGTIEEKIVGLQKRKSKLADIFVNSNNPFKSLSKEMLMTLFD